MLVLGLIALLILYQICGYFSDILRILSISVLFSYLFIGCVDWLQKYIHSRATSVMLVYAVVINGIIFGAFWLAPAVTSQVTQLISTTYDQLPTLVAGATEALQPIEHKLNAAQIQVKAIDILNGIVASIPRLDTGTLFTRVGDVAVSTMTWTMYGLSILVVSFYFLLDGYRMKSNIISLFPKRHELWLQGMASEIDKSLQAFFRGQIVLGLGFGAFMIAVFWFLGVHYSLLLGIILGVFEIVPVIGPPIGFIPTLVAVGINGMDAVPTNRLTQLVIVFLVFQAFQWLKDNIIAPRYIGNVIGLHPVTIFLAIMVGARVDGVLGIIFALPAAAAINVLINHIHHNHAIEVTQLIEARTKASTQQSVAAGAPGQVLGSITETNSTTVRPVIDQEVGSQSGVEHVAQA